MREKGMQSHKPDAFAGRKEKSLDIMKNDGNNT